MKPAARLGLYGAALAAVFAIAALVGNALIPSTLVADWSASAEDDMQHTETSGSTEHPAGHSTGLAIEADGYRLSDVAAPTDTSAAGTLQFRITAADGAAVLDFAVEHEQELHAIVVREDGAYFRHVHPTMDDSGEWSLPWQWDAAGSYRLYADFTVADDGTAATVSQTLQVAGEYAPETRTSPVLSTSVDGYDVAVSGAAIAGQVSTLTVTVSRDGEAITTLQPYLGAAAHLVVLRAADLAYQHVHPAHASDNEATNGPDVAFTTALPSAGLYYLYFDFQIDDEVHTAALALTAETG